MQIKNVENFNLQDCDSYLKNNPNGELAESVRLRQKQLIDQTNQVSREKDEERKRQVHCYEMKTQWIDIAEFNEKKKYKSLSFSRCILKPIVFICLLIVVAAVYFFNTKHYIYEEYSWDQASHVTGIENFLLNCEIIDTHYYWNDSFSPHWDTYTYDSGFWSISFIGIIVFFILLLTSIWHTPFVSKIYNIQDGDKSLKFRAIQNKKGKVGLCKVGRLKLNKILDFDYDALFMINDNSYVCKSKNKFGIYNTDVKKWTVPIIYDSIYAINNNTIDLKKDNQVYSFSHKGYRIVK